MRSPSCVPPACWAERSLLPPTLPDSLLLEGEPVLALLGVVEIVSPAQREVSFLCMSALLKTATEAPNGGQKNCLYRVMLLWQSKALLVRGRSSVTGREGGFQIPAGPWAHISYDGPLPLSSLAQRDSLLFSEVGLVF